MRDGSVISPRSTAAGSRVVHARGHLYALGAAGGGPNGIARGPTARAIVCNNAGLYPPGHFAGAARPPTYTGAMSNGSIPRPRTPQALRQWRRQGRLSAPNVIVFDRMGGFYFTDLGKRYKRHRDHAACTTRCPTDPRSARTPILSSHRTASACRRTDDPLRRRQPYPRGSGPSTSNRRGVVPSSFPSSHGGRLLATLPGFCRFDSRAVEAIGQHRPSRPLLAGSITSSRPAGEVVHSVAMPDTHPTQICFGGETCGRPMHLSRPRRGSQTLPWPEPGLRLNFQQLNDGGALAGCACPPPAGACEPCL